MKIKHKEYANLQITSDRMFHSILERCKLEETQSEEQARILDRDMESMGVECMIKTIERETQWGFAWESEPSASPLPATQPEPSLEQRNHSEAEKLLIHLLKYLRNGTLHMDNACSFADQIDIYFKNKPKDSLGTVYTKV